MASTKDVQDIMGMAPDVRKTSAAKKKKKVVETQPRLSGISREVQALMGDSVPPVQIVETPKYKSKPTLASKLFKVRHWEERPFQHAARSDGLVLRHWKRVQTVARPAPTNGDVVMTDADVEPPAMQFEEEFAMDRWNVKIRVPEYTEEQYEKHFKSEEWTREETDHLMQLASDFDLRWIIVADRYDPHEINSQTNTNGDISGTEVAKTYPDRSMEALKSRYYQVAAKDLELRTPPTNMTQTEFQLWEKMRNFDVKTEALRKTMAEKLFERTKDEAEEEKTLLEELHRITKNEEEFKAMRRDLYARLEAAPSLRRNERGEEQNIVLSSAGLSDLLSRLFAKEKHLKRRVIPNGEAPPTNSQPAADQNRRQSTQVHRRDTIETPVGDPKKGSISAPIVRQLSKAEEEKYGVTHSSERLTSGVSFRHEKINRVTTAKSQVQTHKINAALTELEIPARLSMPTEKVCKEFERLVSQIQLLLDARKTHTRISEEVKVLEEARRQRLGEPDPSANDAVNGTSMDVDQIDAAASQSQTGANDDGIVKKEQRNKGSRLPQSTNDLEDGPGPAVHDDDEEDEDDDAEGEEDTELADATQTQIDDDDEQEEDEENEDSLARKEGIDEDDEDEEEEEENDGENTNVDAEQDDDVEEDEDEEDEEEEEEEEDDDEDEGTRALRRGADNDDDDENDEEDEAEGGNVDEDDDADEIATSHVNGAENDDEEEEEEEEDEVDEEDPDGEDEETQNVSMNETTQNAEDDEDGDESEPEEEQPSRPVSSGSLAAPVHKRSASVISEASKAGSNRSGASRKRKR